MIGKTFGAYRIVEKIGAGGMATVYKAYDPSMDRYVALKVLPEQYAQSPTFRERFRRETKAIARLEHAHILPVYSSGEQDDISYLVMRYIDAGTLADRIQSGPYIPLPEVTRLIDQVASALDYAHQHQIIHRDVKPSNVLLDRNDNAYLTDFGIAKMLEGVTALTGTGLVGTPQYMSPEQCMGLPVDARTDTYALGVVLYEMVARRPPHRAETPYAIIQMKLDSPPPPPRTLRPDLPEAVERVILKALAREPDDRYQTAGEMAAALREVVSRVGDLDETAPEDRLPPVISTPTPPPLSEAPSPPTPEPETPARPTPPATAPARPAEGTRPTWRSPRRWIGLALLGVLTFAVLFLVSILAARFIRVKPTLTPTSTLDTAKTAEAIVASALTATAHVTATANAFDTAVAQALDATGTAAQRSIDLTGTAARQAVATTQAAGIEVAVAPTSTPEPVGMVMIWTPTPEAAMVIPTHPSIELTSVAAAPAAPAATPAPYLTQATSVPSPAISGQIAFTSNRDGDYEIYVTTVGDTAGNARQLTNNAIDDWVPAWSPDGMRIAFQSGSDEAGEIYVIDADGGNMHQLTDNDRWDGDPAWSPAPLEGGTGGTRIAFASDPDGDSEICVMDADGSNVRQLTSNTAQDRWPTWSPDGMYIAFQSSGDGDLEIYVMDAGCDSLPGGCASNTRQLTNNSADDWYPAWSPGGTRIAFASDRDGDSEIYVMNADGSDVRQLTENFVGDWGPAWSPDGSYIAFTSDRDGNDEIYVMVADGSNVRQITSDFAAAWNPSWSPAP